MTKKRLSVAAVILALVLICCYFAVQTPLASKKVKVVTDMAGRQIEIGNLDRIVCLNSECLELLYLLGESKKVVGAGTWARQDPLLPKLYNFSEIPDVGTASRPNVEAIVALKPDLVITYYTGKTQYGYETPKEVVEKLESAGIPVFGMVLAVTKPADWEQYYEMVESFGRLLGKEDKAKDINGYLKRVLSDFRENVSRVKAERVKVLYTWSEINAIAGNSSMVSATIELAGGINVGREIEQPYPRVNPEFIVDKNPDVWIIWHSKSRKYNVSDILNDPRFSSVNAVKNKRVFEEPEFGSNWHPVRAHLYLLWHGKVYYGIPDFDLKAREISMRFYGVEDWWT